MDDLVFLKPNIQVDPLVNRWYAWIHLIPPATSAFNIVKRHMEMMESYIKAPHLHSAAVKNPAMRGGPFIDLDGDKTIAVKNLINDTRKNAAFAFEFTEAVLQLDRMLLAKADGYAMQDLYAEIPEALRGLVELMYDLHNRPTYRFIEALLYESRFYNDGLQSIALSEITGDSDRPFILSTPRIDGDKTLYLPVRFASEKWDELFKMKSTPNKLAFITDLFEIQENDHALFKSFFTTTAPERHPTVNNPDLRIRFFGHACILIEFKNTTILIDPVISYKYASDIQRNTYNELPDVIDYVLITHGHQDHIFLETLLQIRHKTKNVIVAKNMDGLLQDPSLKLMLTKMGFKNVTEINELEKIHFENGFIMGIPFVGEHHDLMTHSKMCFHISLGGKKILAMADSCNIEPVLYENVHRIIGDMDLLFIGMECEGAPVTWVYGPLFSEKPDRKKDRSRRGRGCNYNEALDLVHRFNAKQVYVYAMGAEPWVQYILDLDYNEQSNAIIQSNLLVETCRHEGRVAERLFAEKEFV